MLTPDEFLSEDQDPAVLKIITDYLIPIAGDVGDWDWEEHCLGLAGGILNALSDAHYEVTLAHGHEPLYFDGEDA